MYLDRNLSNKIKNISFKNIKLHNITKGIAITLIFASLLTSCEKNKDNTNINNDNILNDNTSNYQTYEYDEIYDKLCDNGYLLVERNSDGKYYSYRIMNMFLTSKNKNNLSEEYYLNYTPTKNINVITKEEGPNYKNPTINIFKQSSIMRNIYLDNKDKIVFENNKFYIKITEDEFRDYVQNWDGEIYKMVSKDKSKKM